MSQSSDPKIGQILEFWEEQGRRHGADLAATNPDVLAKELEIEALKRHLDPAIATLEAGCGNGFNLFRLAQSFEAPLVGFDYAPALVAAANERLASEPAVSVPLEFHVGDVTGDLSEFGNFGQIFTDRCLINLASMETQIAAVANLASRLNVGGRLVMVESCKQGQEAINNLREGVELPPIAYHWHNLYLDLDVFLERLPPGLTLLEVEDFSSLYFVISRVFNAKLTPEGQAPDYLAPINRIALQLPSIGNCGPLRAIVVEKTA